MFSAEKLFLHEDNHDDEVKKIQQLLIIILHNKHCWLLAVNYKSCKKYDQVN